MYKLKDEWENIIEFMLPDPSIVSISKEIYNTYILHKNKTRNEIDKSYPNWNDPKYGTIRLMEMGLHSKWNYILFVCMEEKNTEYIITGIRILHTNKQYEYASVLYKYFHDDIFEYGYTNICLFYSSYMNDDKYSLRDELGYLNPTDTIGYLTDRQLLEIKEYTKSLGTFIDICVNTLDTADLDMNDLKDHYLDYRIFYSFPDKKISTVASYAWTPIIKSDHSLTFDNVVSLTYIDKPDIATQIVPMHLNHDSIVSNDILNKWNYVSVYEGRIHDLPLIMFINSIEEIYNDQEYDSNLLSNGQNIVLDEYISSL